MPVRDHLRACAHVRNRLGKHSDLGPTRFRIRRRGVQDTVQVALFDRVIIDNYQLADAETGQLLDHWTAGAGAPDHSNRQPPQEIEGALAKGLRMGGGKAGHWPSTGFPLMPEEHVVTGDVDERQRPHFTIRSHDSAEHAAVREHHCAGVRPVVVEPVAQTRQELLVALVIDLGERWVAARMAMHLDQRSARSFGPFQERKDHVGRPGHALVRSHRTGRVRNREHFARNEAGPPITSPHAAEEESCCLQPIAGKQVVLQR